MVKSQTYLTQNSGQTKKLGENLAKKFLARFPNKKAAVLGLKGNLGAGKTTFLQGFARGLGIREKITSPTFVIIKKYRMKRGKNLCYFYHIDCYRIREPKEILDLGFKKIVKDPQNIIAVEWPERVKKILPKEVLILKFDFVRQNLRRIAINQNVLK